MLGLLPDKRELAGAVRAADEITRRQLVMEFGGLLSSDPADARLRLAAVAARVDLPSSTLDSFGERGPESQFFAAAASLLHAPPQHFTRDGIVETMRARGATKADVQPIEEARRGRATNVGFEPAVLAQYKVSCAKHLVANGTRFGWDEPTVRQVYELGHRQQKLRQAETPTRGQRNVASVLQGLAGVTAGLAVGEIGLLIAGAATAAAVTALHVATLGVVGVVIGLIPLLAHQYKPTRTAREQVDQATRALSGLPDGVGNSRQSSSTRPPGASSPVAGRQRGDDHLIGT